MPGDARIRSYFDARAVPFDRIYDRRAGLRGFFEGWVYGQVHRNFELTFAELEDLRGKRVLDVGCGSGRYALEAAERGATVVGIDLAPKMLELARERAVTRGVSESCAFFEADFDAFDPRETFDVVLMVNVIEYRADPHRDIARLYDLAGEKAIVTVPMDLSWQTFVRRLRHWLRAAPPSLYVHRPATLGALIEEVGFESWRSNGGWFVAFR